MILTDDCCDVLVIGGGFFGLNVAELFARNRRGVILCEREREFMTRASYVNQARVHNGYHYPRSLLTAMRSRQSFPRFVRDYADAIVKSFDKYYAVGRILGKITARQFELFCNRIGAPCHPAPREVEQLFDPRFIEAVFKTEEFAFDAAKLRQIMQERTGSLDTLARRTGCTVLSIAPAAGGFDCTVREEDGGERHIRAAEVFNCGYANINFIHANSHLPIIPLKHEMTEMALVEMPEPLEKIGVTVMCGPFFSCMPFPDRKLHTLSHVRYTPHYEWTDRDGAAYRSGYDIMARDPRQSNFNHMRLDAARYLPPIRACRYVDSLWEVKTVLPASEIDDSRPILLKLDYGYPGYHCVMGGKIDNIYDVLNALKLRKGLD